MWCENDCHCDRIAFDSSVFAHMLAKLDSFFTMWRYIGRKPANHHGLVVSVTFLRSHCLTAVVTMAHRLFVSKGVIYLDLLNLKVFIFHYIRLYLYRIRLN